jgi:hypothetical protein
MITQDSLNREYFRWLCEFVIGESYSKSTSYLKLLRYLYSVEFTYTIGMDGNRAEDGTDLRYRFAEENDYAYPIVTAYLDDRPCSVLEMMIALAIRCEDRIMADSNEGDRTGQWFWNMVVSLGLGLMTDSRFDEDRAEEIVSRFLNREYARNGKGGLFTVSNRRVDMRSIEIWYQMCMYLEDDHDA